MIIGVPREIKDNEFRVALIPAGVKALTEHGHQVLVQAAAGKGSGISDEAYAAAGAEIVDSAEAVYGRADLILKVKEPLPSEYGLLRPGQILFTYLHLAAASEVARVLVEQKVTGIAYETVETDKGHLPLLVPMSEVAGRMAAQVGAHLLERPSGGGGILLGGIPGVRPGRVTVLGAGTVGINAARVAFALGAEVIVLLRRKARMVHIDEAFGGRIRCLAANSYNIEEEVRAADLVVGAVLVPGGRAPTLVTESIVKAMRPGSVIVDVSVDQGGCCETTRPTSHSSPTYEVHGVIHYAVANMPGAVPRTATFGLTNETLAYVLSLADLGLTKALEGNAAFARGVNTHQGFVTCEPVATALGYPYSPLAEVLSSEG